MQTKTITSLVRNKFTYSYTVMGLGVDSLREIPHRAAFRWDSQNASWTDGMGDQLGYKKDVEDWATFHNNLADNK